MKAHILAGSAVDTATSEEGIASTSGSGVPEDPPTEASTDSAGDGEDKTKNQDLNLTQHEESSASRP